MLDSAEIVGLVRAQDAATLIDNGRLVVRLDMEPAPEWLESPTLLTARGALYWHPAYLSEKDPKPIAGHLELVAISTSAHSPREITTLDEWNMLVGFVFTDGSSAVLVPRVVLRGTVVGVAEPKDHGYLDVGFAKIKISEYSGLSEGSSVVGMFDVLVSHERVRLVNAVVIRSDKPVQKRTRGEDMVIAEYEANNAALRGSPLINSHTTTDVDSETDGRAGGDETGTVQPPGRR